MAEKARRVTVRGLTWTISGKEYKNRTIVQLLIQGKYKELIAERNGIRRDGLRALAFALKRGAPVDTGELKKSIKYLPGDKPKVMLGPKPFNRAKKKAELAGRKYRARKKGRPKLQGWYARPANRHSRKPYYIDIAIDDASRKMIRKYERLAKSRAR